MTYPTVTVSQEFFSPTQLLDNLPDFKTVITNFIRDPFMRGKANPYDTLDVKGMSKVLENFNFVEFNAYSVFIPEGMVGRYGPMLESLHECVRACTTIPTGSLAPIQQWLGIMLADPGKLKSLRQLDNIQSFSPINTSYLAEQLGQSFNTTHKATKAAIGNVFTNNRDVLENFDKTNAMVEAFIRVDRRDLTSQVEKITVLLDKLYQRLKESPDEYQLSEANLKTLSVLCRTLAEELEFFAMTSYLLKQVTVALNDTHQRLEKR